MCLILLILGVTLNERSVSMKRGRGFFSFLLFLVVFVFAVYLVFSPVFIKYYQSILLNRFSSSLEDARNYYSVVSSSFGVIIGVLGLILGYLYYRNRNQFEAETKERENKRKHLKIFMAELNNYDKFVHKVLSISVRDEFELRGVRDEIDRSFDIIVSMLEGEEKLDLLGLTKEDVNEIIKVHSFVDKSSSISHCPHKDLDLNKLYPIKDQYIELIKKARQKCYIRIK